MSQANPYTGWSAAPGVLELHLAYSPLAYLNALATPVVTLDGIAHPRPWGAHLFELPAGNHHVRVAFTYLFYDACPGAIVAPIYPSHRTVVTYDAPFLRFLSGTMRVRTVVPLS